MTPQKIKFPQFFLDGYAHAQAVVQWMSEIRMDVRPDFRHLASGRQNLDANSDHFSYKALIL